MSRESAASSKGYANDDGISDKPIINNTASNSIASDENLMGQSAQNWEKLDDLDQDYGSGEDNGLNGLNSIAKLELEEGTILEALGSEILESPNNNDNSNKADSGTYESIKSFSEEIKEVKTSTTINESSSSLVETKVETMKAVQESVSIASSISVVDYAGAGNDDMSVKSGKSIEEVVESLSVEYQP